MSATAVHLWGGLLSVGGDEVRVRRSLSLRYRGAVRRLRNADSLGSVLTRAVLGTSAVWSTATMAPDAVAAVEDVSLASLRASASPSALLAAFTVALTVAAIARKAVSDDAVSTAAIDRVEVDEGDCELTIVYERDGRWFSGTRERTLRPVSDDALAKATADFRCRGVEVAAAGD